MKNKLLSTTFLAIVACLLWSSAFVGIKIGLTYTTPMQFAGIRFFISGLLILPFAGNLKSNFTLLKTHGKAIAKISFFQTFLLYALFYWGMSRVQASTGAIIIGASPLFSVVMTHFLLKNDRMNVRKIISVVLGLGGVVIISLSGRTGEIGRETDILGIGILIMANIIGNYGNIIIVKLKIPLSPLLVNAVQISMGGIGLFILSLITEGLSPLPNVPTYYYSLAWLSFLSATAFSIWFVLLNRPNTVVSELNIWKFIIPLAGAVLSWLILPSETPDLISLIGMVMISVALLLLNFRKKG